jgi:3-oxoacyl-[acyl-carrier protein] reductase
MSKTLSGKVALVTGGSRGIGAATARALAEAGAHVAISYAASAGKAAEMVAEIEAKGVKGAAFKADQGDVAQVKQLIGDVVAKFGRLDILVNNAGQFEVSALNTTEDFGTLDRMTAVNVGGVVAAIRAAAPVMADGGRIITMSSGIAARVGAAGVADYASSKAAIEGYTKGAARDLAARNITVNALGVGPVTTDMNPGVGEFADWLRSLTALGRYGTAEEIANVAVFLAGPGASYITGAVIAVDGGAGA